MIGFSHVIYLAEMEVMNFLRSLDDSVELTSQELCSLTAIDCGLGLNQTYQLLQEGLEYGMKMLEKVGNKYVDKLHVLQS